LTTTTHMFTSQLAPFFEKGALIESDNEEVMEKKIKGIFRKEKYKEIVLISRRETEQGKEKICGPRPWYLDKWWQEKLVNYILVEADGAMSKPIKAPAFHEPVIPECTTDLIGVIGIDALGLIIEEKNVFRPHIFGFLTNLGIGEEINIESVVSLVKHPQGLFKNRPNFAQTYLFINKINSKKREKLAEELMNNILKNNEVALDNIIIGNTFDINNPIYKGVFKAE